MQSTLEESVDCWRPGEFRAATRKERIFRLFPWNAQDISDHGTIHHLNEPKRAWVLPVWKISYNTWVLQRIFILIPGNTQLIMGYINIILCTHSFQMFLFIIIEWMNFIYFMVNIWEPFFAFWLLNFHFILHFYCCITDQISYQFINYSNTDLTIGHIKLII